MGSTTELRQEIKRTFIPFMEARGFSIDRRHGPMTTTFRRVTPDTVQVCEMLWDKYGLPRFLICFGTSRPAGATVDGRTIPIDEIYPWNTEDNGNLKPRRGPHSRHWFRQDTPLLHRLLRGRKMYPPEQVISNLITLFPEIEAYWNTGETGPHLQMTRKLK